MSNTIGIDVGTSGCKAVLLDEQGRAVAVGWRSYTTRRHPDGAVTQNPEHWLRAAAAATRDCLSQTPGVRVAGVAVTAPAHAAVLVDAQGVPLHDSLLAFDGRASAVAARLRAEYGPGFYERTLVELTSGWTLPQLVWLRQTLGARTWARVRYCLVQKDYVRFRMTGTVATDPSDAAGTAMYAPRAGDWDYELARDAGLAADQLPPIRPAFELAGGVTASWARRTGLPRGTPVAIGCTDTPADLLSVGAIEPGDSLVKIASTGSVVAVSDEPKPDPLLLTYPHCIPDRWYSAAATNTAATAFSWLRQAAFAGVPDRPDGYAMIIRLAAKAPPGSDGALFLPFLDGERCPYWDRDLRGAFLGLSAAHRPEHIARAVLEGVAFSLRGCRDVMERVGHTADAPYLTGGGVASTLWRRILVSVLGGDGRLASPQGPALGAALIASSAVRGDRSGTEPARLRRSVRIQRPCPDWELIYDRLYRTYEDAALRVTAVSHALSVRSTVSDRDS